VEADLKMLGLRSVGSFWSWRLAVEVAHLDRGSSEVTSHSVGLWMNLPAAVGLAGHARDPNNVSWRFSLTVVWLTNARGNSGEVNKPTLGSAMLSVFSRESLWSRVA
jgi:hypothetical protein